MNMTTVKKYAAYGVLAVVVATTPGLAFAEQIKGMIIGRDGMNMILRTDSGKKVVALTDSTVIKGTSGMFAANVDTHPGENLIPGLPVNIQAEDRGGVLTATSVRFKNDHLVVAQQVEAGLNPVNEVQARHGTALQQHDAQLEEQRIKHENLVQRFEQHEEYEVKATADVNFDTNSSKLSDDAKKKLEAIASQAKGFKGYMIHVSGHADARGSAQLNQALSHKRAMAVVNYLQQNTGVDIMRVLAPDPMGTAKPASTDNTPAGLAANRRVTVEVLVNKGMST
jgi:outer membrane protein OmpA-like peptidoglycan-associated protein